MKTLYFSSGTLVALFLWATLSAASAADSRTEGRIDIIGTGRVQIDVTGEGVRIERATWEGTQAEKHVVVSFVATEEWRATSVTIIPSATGKVHLFLMGPQPKPTVSTGETVPVRMGYDKFQSDSDIINGSFESGMEGWKRVDLASKTLSVTEENGAKVVEGEAAEGKHFAIAWHNSRLSQPISVEAGRPVTITFSYRLQTP